MPTSKCWLYEKCVEKDGYARLTIKGMREPVHRIAYRLFKGPIPRTKQIDHLCRIRNCFNPEHLEAVTCRENILRGIGLPSKNAKKTHCPQGHEYAGENKYIMTNGSRSCRTCRNKNNNVRMKKLYLKRKNASN